jgi:hypothetical protein
MLQRSNCYLQPTPSVLKRTVHSRWLRQHTQADHAKDFGRFYAFFTPRVQS